MTMAYYAPWWIVAASTGSGTAAIGEVTTDADWTIWNTLFTLGTISGNNSLPVELVNFNTFKEETNTLINWETAAEVNSDYFSVLRSSNGVDFEEIGQRAAAGVSNDYLEYSFIDKDPFNGTNTTN